MIERSLLAASSSERSLKSTRSSSRALSNSPHTMLLRVVSWRCDAAVRHFGITMLRRSLSASGSSRNQNTSGGSRRHHRPLVGMERWSSCVACTGHHPTSTSDVVMRALWHSCWFRLGPHVDEPLGNLFASRNDDCDWEVECPTFEKTRFPLQIIHAS